MKKIIRLTESELIRLIKNVISEQTSTCKDPKIVLNEIPESFADFVSIVKSQKNACGSKCPTVKGSTAQDFADKYTEKVEYLWGGLDSLYEPDELYMFDSMSNEIINIILEKYGAPWRISSNSRPNIEEI
jgi:hypothetical protein